MGALTVVLYVLWVLVLAATVMYWRAARKFSQAGTQYLVEAYTYECFANEHLAKSRELTAEAADIAAGYVKLWNALRTIAQQEGESGDLARSTLLEVDLDWWLHDTLKEQA